MDDSMPKLSLSKKRIAVYIGMPVILVTIVCLIILGNDARRFHTLTETIFESELSENTLNLHYTLANPENFGIKRYDAVLPCYSAEGRDASVEALSAYIDTLARIDADRLNDGEQYTYCLLSRFLTHAMEGTAFPYYDEPLSPSGGMQSQLPILLAEYTFREVQDVEDYLALLDQTDTYFASLLEYEKEKKEAGLLQADTSLLQVQKQCYSLLSEEELETGTHFLQTTFSQRLDQLVEAGLMTSQEADDYISQNNRLLNTVMQPAYEALGDGLFLLMGDGTSTPTGLCSFPQGRAYYEWLVKKNTASSLSIEEIKELLYPQFEAEYAQVRTLLTATPDAADIWIEEVEGDHFPLSRPAEMIQDVQFRMEEDFPGLHAGADLRAQGLNKAASGLPMLTLKAVSPSLQEYCAPAFYLTPPLDDTENNVIYINEKTSPHGLELYTTLAHEGYPGHLYQSVYSQRNMLANETDPVRQILWYGGYLEGWALYVEFLSYDYAAELAEENGDADAAYAYTIEKHNRNMQLCLYALLDIAIHYDGATYEQIHNLLSGFGIKNPETTRNIYDYIAEEPANYLKYYLGYLEILRLKESAKVLWDEDYSDLRFHTFFLESGPSDFTTLTEALEQY